jgi:Amt family ammonium transporter
MALVLGPRRGWPKNRAKMGPHNLPLVLSGAALLWFGWFGFNGGSALRLDDGVAAYAFLNTNTAAAAGLLTWVLMEWVFSPQRKATTIGAASGVLAGLVSITPAAGYVQPVGAAVIGAVSGLVCSIVVSFKTRLRYDDSLDVAALHLVGGVIGSLGVGLFATDAVNKAVEEHGAAGLFYGGGGTQLGAQALTVAAVVAYSFIVTYFLGRLIGAVVGNRGRVPETAERDGLDQALHGESAYKWANTP